MGKYDAQTASALTLIKKKGVAITFARETKSGVYDPVTGEYPTTSSTASGYGVLLSWKQSQINGDTIKSTDRKVIYSGEAPKIGDTYDNSRVSYVDPLNPDNSTPIIYTVGLRL